MKIFTWYNNKDNKTESLRVFGIGTAQISSCEEIKLSRFNGDHVRVIVLL